MAPFKREDNNDASDEQITIKCSVAPFKREDNDDDNRIRYEADNEAQYGSSLK